MRVFWFFLLWFLKSIPGTGVRFPAYFAPVFPAFRFENSEEPTTMAPVSSAAAATAAKRLKPDSRL